MAPSGGLAMESCLAKAFISLMNGWADADDMANSTAYKRNSFLLNIVFAFEN
jgi:hypothetical protein